MSVNLPRFQQSAELVDDNKLPTVAFHIWWDQFAGKLEQALTDLTTAQATANTAIANAAAAAAQALAAANAALAAQTAADVVKRDDSISTSWTSPGSTLSATDAGTDATVTIANHVRHYSDNSSVSVTGSSIIALAYTTTYYIYYDQTSRAGGAVTYHAVTDPNTAQPNSAAGRHFLGKIITPAAAGAPTGGGYTPPGGYSGSGEVP